MVALVETADEQTTDIDFEISKNNLRKILSYITCTLEIILGDMQHNITHSTGTLSRLIFSIVYIGY